MALIPNRSPSSPKIEKSNPPVMFHFLKTITTNCEQLNWFVFMSVAGTPAGHIINNKAK